MHPYDENGTEAIEKGAMSIGVRLPAGAAQGMARHLDLVYRENGQCNLTRIPSESAIALHVLDSLTGLSALGDSVEGPWLDLGSGAGFPGVTLALATGRRVDLLESVGKKARFLDVVCRELCLNATVLGRRAEEAAAEHREVYAAVRARAVSELPALVELAAPLLMTGGLLVCWKGDPDPDELSRGDAVAALAGMGPGDVTRVVVPGVDARRCLVRYEKVGRGRIALPRRVGLAQSRPLA
jgi:16S rRNA (guanine527-N7)-methyltransferase